MFSQGRLDGQKDDTVSGNIGGARVGDLNKNRPLRDPEAFDLVDLVSLNLTKSEERRTAKTRGQKRLDSVKSD